MNGPGLQLKRTALFVPKYYRLSQNDLNSYKFLIIYYVRIRKMNSDMLYISQSGLDQKLSANVQLDIKHSRRLYVQ